MRLPALPVLCALAAPLTASCRSEAGEPAAPPEVHAADLPASALGGAVRALETLDAVRPAGALTQLRALLCDTLVDHAAGVESVRVFLDVSVFAETSERAREVFDELHRALENEARSGARVELASAERVRRVMAVDWDPPGREDLLSYSDVIRLEFRPGRPAPEPWSDGTEGAGAHESLASYVRRTAAQRIGQVDVSVARDPTRRDVSEHRFRITPSDSFACYTRTDIGEFLAALEGGSPAARLTSLRIERSQHEPDVHAERGWTFEAELGVSTPPDGSASTNGQEVR